MEETRFGGFPLIPTAFDRRAQPPAASGAVLQRRSILEIVHVPRGSFRAGVVGAGDAGELPRHPTLMRLSLGLGRVFSEDGPLPKVRMLFRPFSLTVLGIRRNADSASHVWFRNLGRATGITSYSKPRPGYPLSLVQ